MKKKDVLLVLVVILIPIVLLGAIAVMGADNIQDSISFEGDKGAYTVAEYDLENNAPVANSNITDGVSVHKDTDYSFVVTVSEGYTGTPIVQIVDGETLEPVPNADNLFVYTVHIDEDPIKINISGLSPA
ncbi:hypothetical protein [Candidatus Methanomassiliicoccus intestinalis]|uniref:hypothetical protein n=1 Tax=Candidatus Methanomassiliicoccus intestinalis TaxID=1406512 RepID=UPI0037DC2A30